MADTPTPPAISPPAAAPPAPPGAAPAVAAPAEKLGLKAYKDPDANVWSWQANDKNGDRVQFAPGKTTIVCRGPSSRVEVIQSAKNFLRHCNHLHAVENGEHPGFELDEESVKPIGSQAVTDANVGTFSVPGGVPIEVGVTSKLRDQFATK